MNLGDAPEAGALAAAVASAAVGATSSPASASGFSKAVDEPSSNQGGPQAPGATGSVAHDKDNDVEGKLFIGGISWQTTEEGLRYWGVCLFSRSFADRCFAVRSQRFWAGRLSSGCRSSNRCLSVPTYTAYICTAYLHGARNMSTYTQPILARPLSAVLRSPAPVLKLYLEL